jgi:HEPN domain-containing protein
MSEADPPSIAQWAEARRWFAKASEDLQVANLAMVVVPPFIEPAAYHCQQAAEKLFKGLLVSVAIDVPRTHDLERLAALLAGVYRELAEDIQALAVLSPWSVLTRYPQLESDIGITSDDVLFAIQSLIALHDKVLARAP